MHSSHYLAFTALAGAILLASGCGRNVSQGAASGTNSAASKPASILSAAWLGPRRPGEASDEGRMAIGRGQDYSPINEDPAALFSRLESSMADRRAAAWKIVEAVLQPQRLTVNGQTYDVPLWHTWYEGMDGNPEVGTKIKLFFANVKRCQVANCTKSPDEIARDTMATGAKNLAASLTDTNLTQKLRQFQIAGSTSPEALGRGFTLFSPSFVEHLLAHAKEIESCSANRARWNDAPPSPTQFSPCMAEFPRSAVMIKAQWMDMGKAATSPDTSPQGMTALLTSHRWPIQTGSPGDPTKMYALQTREGKTYGLQALHISTKDTREWVWITLWWSPQPNADYGEDRPASIGRYNGGIWGNYKMCVTTSFREGDRAPWSSYEQKQTSLAASLRATYAVRDGQRDPSPYDEMTTWCSNGNIERQAGNGGTNCIGCHQYSMAWNEGNNDFTGFDETYDPANQDKFPQRGRSRRRGNFPGDFSWSMLYEDLPAVMARERQANGVVWP
jgi:hypothetical protein